MIGKSPAMLNLLEIVGKAALTMSNVLIEGESGTGKELVARELHRQSPRARGPFIAVNCAALPETLLESEFFGHERGSFTGAIGRQKGKFELAQGGTLLLDEAGELSLPIQAKLLRALEDRTIYRIGGKEPVRLDVRFLAATNRDLSQEVASGCFREDLYYRLKVLHLRTPPLRDRPEDIPALCAHVLKGLEATKRISAEAEAVLMRYYWPGNVRELRNVIEHAVALGSGDVVLVEDLPDAVFNEPPVAPCGYYEVLDELKRQVLTQAFQNAGGNRKRAAELLRLPAQTVDRHLRNLRLTHLRRKLGDRH